MEVRRPPVTPHSLSWRIASGPPRALPSEAQRSSSVYGCSRWKRSSLADDRHISPGVLRNYTYAMLAAAVTVLYVSVGCHQRFWYAPDRRHLRTRRALRSACRRHRSCAVCRSYGRQRAPSARPARRHLPAPSFARPARCNCIVHRRSRRSLPVPRKQLPDRVAQWRRVPVLLGLAALICLAPHLATRQLAAGRGHPLFRSQLHG